MTVSDFYAYLSPGSAGHLVGIGGVSMSALAEALAARGLRIQGSDAAEGPAVAALRGRGVSVAIGHRAENIAGADFLVRTAAVRDDNPEVRAARAAGVPVFERSMAWGALMREYRSSVCVAGTHGKTTTTGMVTHLLMAAGRDPAVMIGGTLPLIGGGYRAGGGDVFVLESCEYYNAYHSFSPTVAVILNIDDDHLDFFGSLDNIKASFRAFAALTPADGCVVYNAEDANTREALAGLARPQLSFGFAEGADVRAVNLTGGESPAFDVLYKGGVWARAVLGVRGRHNVSNALAACAAAIALGVPGEAAEGLRGFTGTGRRLEYKGNCGGAAVYDDYAHHPTELTALLRAVREMDFRRVLLAFQPHTYSRVKQHYAEFLRALALPDRVYLADIYAARETDDLGVSAQGMAAEIPGAVYCPGFRAMADRLRADARAGDVILTVGAGDIYKVAELLTKGD